jgi:hypothetical protein
MRKTLTLFVASVPTMFGEKRDAFSFIKEMDLARCFVNTGNPNHQGLPEWKPFSIDTPETMFLAHKPSLRTNTEDANFQLYRKL